MYEMLLRERTDGYNRAAEHAVRERRAGLRDLLRRYQLGARAAHHRQGPPRSLPVNRGGPAGIATMQQA